MDTVFRPGIVFNKVGVHIPVIPPRKASMRRGFKCDALNRCTGRDMRREIEAQVRLVGTAVDAEFFLKAIVGGRAVTVHQRIGFRRDDH